MPIDPLGKLLAAFCLLPLLIVASTVNESNTETRSPEVSTAPVVQPIPTPRAAKIPVPDPRRDLEDRASRVFTMLAVQDFEAVHAMTSPDFQRRHPVGEFTERMATLAGILSEVSAWRRARIESIILHESGTSALVMGTVPSRISPRLDPDGFEHRWILVGGEWFWQMGTPGL